MNTAKSFEPFSTVPELFKAGDDDLLMVSDNDEGDPSLTVNQYTDLAPDFKRQPAKGFRHFWRDDGSRWGASTVEIVQSTNLICFKAAYIAVDFDVI